MFEEESDAAFVIVAAAQSYRPAYISEQEMAMQDSHDSVVRGAIGPGKKLERIIKERDLKKPKTTRSYFPIAGVINPPRAPKLPLYSEKPKNPLVKPIEGRPSLVSGPAGSTKLPLPPKLTATAREAIRQSNPGGARTSPDPRHSSPIIIVTPPTDNGQKERYKRKERQYDAILNSPVNVVARALLGGADVAKLGTHVDFESEFLKRKRQELAR